MVFTHLPSNVLLAAIAFAPNLAAAIALLLARSRSRRWTCPTRQAYVVAVVDPSERTAAAAYTNTARYVTRPLAPLLAGAGAPPGPRRAVPLAGALKSVYDIGLYLLFRDVRVGRPDDATSTKLSGPIDDTANLRAAMPRWRRRR